MFPQHVFHVQSWTGLVCSKNKWKLTIGAITRRHTTFKLLTIQLQLTIHSHRRTNLEWYKVQFGYCLIVWSVLRLLSDEITAWCDAGAGIWCNAGTEAPYNHWFCPRTIRLKELSQEKRRYINLTAILQK